MTNQVIKILQTTPEQYEVLLLDIYIEWCCLKTKNLRSYQKLLTCPPLFNWFRRELSILEENFVKDYNMTAALYFETPTIAHIYMMYKISTSTIFNRYSMPLLKHANKYSLIQKKPSKKMREPTEKEINKALKKIETLDHFTMCKLWRFSPAGSEIYFRADLPTGDAFSKRLWGHFGGFTPEISKQLGH